MSAIFSENNFNLIRLFAAAQVAISHCMKHLGYGADSILLGFLQYFPGVPIFFFISGFLISKSYEKNSSLIEYSENRALRIFPALLACTIFSLLSVFLLGYFSTNVFDLRQVFLWFISQVTFLQFYHPEVFSSYGVGVINGSLWTISVELQFYILIPIVYRFLGCFQKISVSYVLLILVVVFFMINRIYLSHSYTYGESILSKLAGVSFAPWFYMFLIGVLAQKHFDLLHKHLSGRFFLVWGAYMLAAYIGVECFGAGTGNAIAPVLYLLLAGVVFAAAYSGPSATNFILGKSDLSYGVYIYHMPIVNAFLFVGWGGKLGAVLGALCLTFSFALFSWKFIEFPSLMLKRHPLNPLRR